MKPTVNAIDRKNLARAISLLNSGPREIRQRLEFIVDVAPRERGALDATEKRALKELQRRDVDLLKERGQHSISPRVVRAHRLHVVNRALEKYLCFPQFEGLRPARMRWVPDSRLSKDKGRMASAMRVLVSLAERELLFRLRRCDRCRRWFEGPEKKKFHSIACREQAFLESERGKKWRQAYQRAYMAKMRKKAKKEEREFFEREQALRSKVGEPKRRSHSMKGH